MKMSNKILLGGFLFLILLITGIHITLYAKYKNGYYTDYPQEGKEQQLPVQSFPNISTVTIRNSNAVIEFGQEASIEKGKDDLIAYEQKGDSLVITGRNESAWSENKARVKLIIPYTATVSTVNSSITFENPGENADLNPTVFLTNSNAVFASSGTLFRLGHVTVNAVDRSIIEFRGNAAVSQLEAQLNKSTLKYNEGDIGQLSIVTDSTSQLALQSKHLLKAKIIPMSKNP
jgi:hypothetical protein